MLGPSGSGKSTMLRMLTGLSTPSAGQVYWHGKPSLTTEINVSIVFQSFALFPWLTVLENVEAPLQARGVSPDERRERSMKMLDTVGLDGFEAAYPKELSGGMKQRVGFARALVVEPEVLFMDEPFSALDVLTAENLRSELLEAVGQQDDAYPSRLHRHPQHRGGGTAGRPHHRAGPQPRARPHRLQGATGAAEGPQGRALYPTGGLHLYRADQTGHSPHRSAWSNKPRFATNARCTTRCCPTRGRRRGRPARTAVGQGRRDDIYRLADDLAFEIDDLLPIVDAAQLLGFLIVEEGDAAITESGTEFANSEILRQKELFRDAAVGNVLLLRQIRRALETKSDHTVPEDFFLDMLDEQFSEEECPAPDGNCRGLGPLRRSCSTSTPDAAALCCPTRRKKRSPPARS